MAQSHSSGDTGILQEQAEFVAISAQGFAESLPHGK
jgi:hypothetical protein